MAQFIERVALQWFEVQAGRVRVLKGHPSQLKLNALRLRIAAERKKKLTT